MQFLARYRQAAAVAAIQQSAYYLLTKRMKLTYDSSLKGMTVLDRSRFKTRVQVPVIKIPKNEYNVAKRTMRAFALESLVNVKKFQDIDASDELSKTHKYLLLDPDVFSFDKLDESVKTELTKIIGVVESTTKDVDLKSRIETINIDIEYQDLKFEQVMKAIIPDEIFAENLNPKSYSVIGHIAHFNLRDKLLDYKHIIGETLLDKIGQIKTVVNKLNEIDNTYRNFAFEFMAGEKNTLVACRENGCEFRFDFANVYWNPRLSTEHERVVKLLEAEDVLYDVFAGVGPFSVPAAVVRRLDSVVCNDLNPESYRFLLDNYKNNTKSKTKMKEIEERKRRVGSLYKVPPDSPLLPNKRVTFNPKELFSAYNMDGREFIRGVVKYHLAEVINYRQVNKIDEPEFKQSKGKYYVLMNLPALSLEFLDSFCDLYDPAESQILRDRLGETVVANFHLNIHCYHFCRDQPDELDAIKQRIRGIYDDDENLQVESKWVRKVAPSKDMFCSIFKLQFKHLMYNQEREVNKKKKKLVEDEGDDNSSSSSPSSNKIAKTTQ